MTPRELEVIFQSTLPMRGATGLQMRLCSNFKHFNPHSPCGERRDNVQTYIDRLVFQSTLPMRGATVFPTVSVDELKFQSTLPMRGATGNLSSNVTVTDISIHTPHAGSDQKVFWHYQKHTRFQSTLPMRGAT